MFRFVKRFCFAVLPGMFWLFPVSAQTNVVDFTTLSNKVMVGYQGWHWAEGDGSDYNDWNHWCGRHDTRPDPSNNHMDIYPDMSEYTKTYNTDYYTPGGTRMKVYSAQDYSTVDLHFQWMEEYNIDGAFIQRFLNGFDASPTSRQDNRDNVLANAKTAAEAHGRAFVVMYDISGQKDSTLYADITRDWTQRIVGRGYLNSPNYLHHKGKPLVVIWGMGVNDRPPVDPQDAQDVIDWFKAQGCTVMGGVPADWRTLTGSSRTDPQWADVYASYDVISPWFVGSFNGLTGADAKKESHLLPDVGYCNSLGVDYMPVAFPGFSWSNWNVGEPNAFERLGGDFIWQQAYNVKTAGANMLYIAMFDEVDEATAIYKLAPSAAESPTTVGNDLNWVTLDIDGYTTPEGDPLPSDWYLQVADEINKMFKGETPITDEMPLLEHPPRVIVSNAPPNYLASQPFTLYLYVTGNTGYYSVDDVEEDGPWGPITTNAPAQILITDTTKISFYTQNALGSRPVESFVIYFDTVVPTISITDGPATNYTATGPFNVTLHTDEPWGYWSTNGSPYVHFANTNEVTINESCTLAYYAEDEAGNSTPTNTLTYIIDPVGYGVWVDELGVAIGAPEDDYDEDGYNNLYEYAFAGDPTNSLDHGVTPELIPTTDAFLYTFWQRIDDTNLVYTVGGRTNLVTDPWTMDGISYLTKVYQSGTDFDKMYYSISTLNKPRHFIRVEVENP